MIIQVSVKSNCYQEAIVYKMLSMSFKHVIANPGKTGLSFLFSLSSDAPIYFASGLFCNSTSGNAKTVLVGTGLRPGFFMREPTPVMELATRAVRTMSNQRLS